MALSKIADVYNFFNIGTRKIVGLKLKNLLMSSVVSIAVNVNSDESVTTKHSFSDEKFLRFSLMQPVTFVIFVGHKNAYKN